LLHFKKIKTKNDRLESYIFFQLAVKAIENGKDIRKQKIYNTHTTLPPHPKPVTDMPNQLQNPGQERP
jgi:hypothetical protein